MYIATIDIDQCVFYGNTFTILCQIFYIFQHNFMQFDKSSHNFQGKIYCALLNSRSILLLWTSITVVSMVTCLQTLLHISWHIV